MVAIQYMPRSTEKYFCSCLVIHHEYTIILSLFFEVINFIHFFQKVLGAGSWAEVHTRAHIEWRPFGPIGGGPAAPPCPINFDQYLHVLTHANFVQVLVPEI